MAALLFILCLNFSLLFADGINFSYHEWHHDNKLSKYLEYEKCVVFSNRLDDNSSFANQESCKRKVSEKYPPLFFPWQNHKSIHSGLFSECMIGLSSFNLLERTRLDGELCYSRSVLQRNGLRNSWFDANGYEAHMNFFQSAAVLWGNRPIKKIVFLGDSITQQISSFLSCDLTRTKNFFYINGPFNTTPTGKKFTETTTFENHNNHKFFIETTRTYLGPCMDEFYNATKPKRLRNMPPPMECNNLENKKASIYYHVRESLLSAKRGSSIQSPYIIIYNVGLHINKTSAEWIIEPTAEALLNFAKFNRNKYYVIFRETSAQHFSDRIGGSFHNEKSPLFYNTNRYCCNLDEKKQNIPLGRWTDDLLLKSLDSMDKNWRNYLDWLPFYDMTNALYDLHAEGNAFGKSDCTHFIYIPFLFYPLWSNLFEIVANKSNLIH